MGCKYSTRIQEQLDDACGSKFSLHPLLDTLIKEKRRKTKKSCSCSDGAY